MEAIIDAKFDRVAVGAVDPNPKHAGRGITLLRAAGIEVVTGILETEAAKLNRGFNKWIVTGLPWVIAKFAMSLDGRITRLPREGAWLSNEQSRNDAHRLRARVDAILIGAGTLRADNPRLTVRGVRKAGRQPWRVVMTRSGNLPETSHLFTDEFRERTLVYEGKGLRAVLRELGKRGVTSLLIEGGTSIFTEAFSQELVDQVRVYAAPLLVGGPAPAIAGAGLASPLKLENAEYRRLGSDLVMEADVVHSPR